MANGRFQFCSDCLRRMVEFHMVLPNDLPKEWTAENPHYKRPIKTLFLLHGYTGGSMDWMTGSAVCELAGNYNLAVVCPAGKFFLSGRPGDRAQICNLCRGRTGAVCEENLRAGAEDGGYLYRRPVYGRIRRDPYRAAV